MAAAIAGFLQRSNMGQGTWNWGDVAFGFRSGLLLNQSCLSEIANNNQPYLTPPPPLSRISYLRIPSLPYDKAKKIARIDNLMALHLSNIYYSTQALALIDLLALYYNVHDQKISQARTPLQKFLIRAWKATPYLVLVTNIALTILELRTNCMKASVALVVTSITLLNFAKITPQSWAWINPGIRIPMDLIALYYGSNKNRFCIVAGWMSIPFEYPMFKFTGPYISRQMIRLPSLVIGLISRISPGLAGPALPILTNLMKSFTPQPPRR